MNQLLTEVAECLVHTGSRTLDRDQSQRCPPSLESGQPEGSRVVSRLLLNTRFIISSISQAVRLFSSVQLFVTPRTATRQDSLPITNSWSLPKLMSIESMMPSNHLIPCHPLLLPSIFPNIRIFSNESALCIRWSKYWSFSFSISPSMNTQG